MRLLHATAVVVMGSLASARAASACGEPSTGCGPWYENLSDSLVGTLSAGMVAFAVGTALAVLLLAKWPRLHRAASILLTVHLAGLLGAAVAFAAIRG